MDIKLIKPFDDDFIKETIAKWNMMAKKSYPLLIGYLFISIINLALGLSHKHRSVTFWNFQTCMAISFGLIFIISLLNLIEGRIKSISNAKKCIDYKKREPLTEYIFNDEKVIIKDSESYGEVNWSAFGSYQIYKGFLFLFFKMNDTGSIAIPERLFLKMIMLR